MSATSTQLGPVNYPPPVLEDSARTSALLWEAHARSETNAQTGPQPSQSITRCTVMGREQKTARIQTLVTSFVHLAQVVPKERPPGAGSQDPAQSRHGQSEALTVDLVTYTDSACPHMCPEFTDCAVRGPCPRRLQHPCAGARPQHPESR